MKSKFTRILGVGLAIAFLSSFLVVAPVSADVSQPVVVVDDEEISAPSEYVITFDVNDAISDNVDGWIEVRFPDDTVVADATGLGDITLQSTAGFGTANDVTDVPTANVTVTEDDDIYTVLIAIEALATDIGEGARVRVTFTTAGAMVTNPTEPGDYTLEVRTAEEDDWVDSAEYTIEIPDIEVPGSVKRYNPADILMEIYTGAGNIQDAINAAGDEDTLVLGDGTYTEAAINVPVGLDELVIEADGTAEETIIEGALTIEGDELTLSGVTILGSVTVDGAEDVIIENCIFDEDLATQLMAVGAIDLTVEGCTFDVTDDSDTGVDVDADSDVVIEDCTFAVEDGTTAIDTDNVTEVTDCTITGSSGIGIVAAAATSDVEVTDSTFDTLAVALDINDGTVLLDGNTIQNTEDEAVNIADCTAVSIVSNVLQDNEDDAIFVADTANASLIQVMFNSFSGNDIDIDTNADQDLNIANNWWGTADGPDSDLIEGDVIDEPWLGSAASDGEIDTASDSLDAEDTAGVVVSSDADVDVISVASYASNPQAATEDPATSFFDVYILDEAAAATEINIRLYGDVTEDSLVYMWGEVQGDWVEASDQGVSLFGGYIWLTVEDEDTVPTIEDLSGTVFAIVEPEVDEELEVELLAPELGEDDISVMPTLTWTAVDDAIGYEIAVAEDDAFSILDYSATSTLNAHVVEEELKYSTAYYWQVRAVTGPAAPKQPAPGGAWEIGIFTTMAEPTPEVPAIVVEQITPTAPIIKVEPVIELPPEKVTKVTIPSPVKPIDPALLWTIVGIGAILVIALIVLIVRTRRVA